MLSDRPYMNQDYSRERTSVHVWLVAGLAAAFILELILLSPWWPSGQQAVAALVMTIPALKAGHAWVLLTHALIHDNTNPFHIAFVALMLFFIGRDLTPVLGPRRLVGVFVGSILLGALAWTGVHWWNPAGGYFGASAGVLGLLVVSACVFPDSQLSFLFIPTAFRMRHFVWVLAGLDGFGLLLYEIRGAAAPFSLAPSAHLGGMLAGWLYYRFFHARDGWDRAERSFLRLPSWLRRKPANSSEAHFQVKLSERAGLRSEVDRILDKINSHGFGSLTPEEKRLLDEAKDLLSRR
ncbi:MAG TPA: rhomboid family intramembrane serine protease [Candidatus Didemnitutus sp.]|nr:rhomboid family intramembrane serine protease [Candidatus Didemnitutus sp.]